MIKVCLEVGVNSCPGISIHLGSWHSISFWSNSCASGSTAVPTLSLILLPTLYHRDQWLCGRGQMCGGTNDQCPGLDDSRQLGSSEGAQFHSLLLPGADEPYEKQNHSLPVKKRGLHVTTHTEGNLRKETTSWQLWALGYSCQTHALWLVFLSQNRSM